jgi:hypothetical protein
LNQAEIFAGRNKPVERSYMQFRRDHGRIAAP